MLLFFKHNGNQILKGIVLSIIILMMLSTIPMKNSAARAGTITVRDPDGGETLIAGSTTQLRWSISDTGGYVWIYLSTDGGASYQSIDTVSSTPSHGTDSYDWLIPANYNYTKCRIKLMWTDGVIKPFNIHAEDISDANFTIAPGVSITFTEMPTLVSYGRYYLTTWDLYDPEEMVDSLTFKWRINEGSGYGAWLDLPGFFDDYDPLKGWIWWSPSYYESATAQMQVEAMAENGITVLDTDVSASFDIISPSVTLIQPDGGVTLVAGSTYTIKWHTSADPEQVIHSAWLRYSINGGTDWLSVGPYTDNDFEYDWTVPSTATTQLVVQAIALYGEWQSYGDDISSSYNTIITSSSTPSITLLDPNPPVDGGLIIGSGESFPIRWSMTGYSGISQLKIYYSTNNGTDYTLITTLTGVMTSPHYWTAPAVDTYYAMVKIEMYPTIGSMKYVESNHKFYIFNTISFNRPPVAIVGEDQTGIEGDRIDLDGSGSYDPDGDLLIYNWTQIQPDFIEAYLVNPTTSTPHFYINELHHFPVTFVFQLEVSDGYTHSGPLIYNVDRVTVTLDPRPPQLDGFHPDTGWTDTQLFLDGDDMMGAEVLLGSQVIHSVPTSAFAGNPDPDHHYHFRLPAGLPLGEHVVSIRTMLGSSVAVGTIEIFPVPQWQYDHGIGFPNNSTHTLSYPWNPSGNGRYKDVFGDQVYLSLWICIGIPYWTPWTGWDCLGYLIKEPFAPDPLAAIYYGAVFCWIARNGECFGMSTTALQHYHGDVSTSQFGQSGVTDWSDLQREGAFQNYVSSRQGSQMSAEILNGYLYGLINSLVPSTEISGMGVWISQVKAAIDSGELGIATMIDGNGAHAVVPYSYEEDGDIIRFYVYDSNRDQFSSPEDASMACTNFNDPHDSPPYIEIDRSGVYWDWSFEWADGSMWGSNVGLAFVPYSTINGPRTLPTSVEGIIQLLAGSANVQVEDEGGNISGVADDGELLWGIEEAAPLPIFGGQGYKPQSYYLPVGNYTTHISGTEDGTYNWSMINNGTSAFWIEEAEVKDTSRDVVTLSYEEGNPYRGWMGYGTNDGSKNYTASIVNKFGPRNRIYRITHAELSDDGRHGDHELDHGFGTNEDYSGIVFTNYGEGPVTIGVEFQTNVVSEEVYNGTNPPESPMLPTAGRDGITVGPGETISVRPVNWLDLDNSLVIIEGESVPDHPTDLIAVETDGKVLLEWTAPANDGGWPILNYIVMKGDTPDDLTAYAEVANATFTDENVSPGSTYYYSVRAANALGDGNMTGVVSITLTPEFVPGSPDVPKNLSVVESDGSVTLTWDAPDSDGGSPITGYIVLRGTISGNLTELIQLGNVLEYSDSSGERNTTYFYQVLALNSIGNGFPTAEVSIKISPEAGDDEPPDDDDGEEDGDEKDNSWIIFLIIAVVLVVIILIAAVFVFRRSGPDEGSMDEGQEPSEEDEGEE